MIYKCCLHLDTGHQNAVCRCTFLWSRSDFVALSDHLGTAYYTYSVVCQVSFWSSWIIYVEVSISYSLTQPHKKPDSHVLMLCMLAEQVRLWSIIRSLFGRGQESHPKMTLHFPLHWKHFVLNHYDVVWCASKWVCFFSCVPMNGWSLWSRSVYLMVAVHVWICLMCYVHYHTYMFVAVY